jgi:hypothetical protein
MPKLKYDLALVQHDDITYGFPDDANERGKSFLLHGVGEAPPGPVDAPPSHARVAKGTEVTCKLTLDDGTPPGFQRVVIVVGDEEVFTGDWALE